MNYKRQNKSLKKIFKIIFLIIFVIIILILAKLFLPSFKKIDYRESVNLETDEIGVNFQFDYIPMKNSPKYFSGETYLPIDFVKQYIDEYIYWDTEENAVTITNEKNVIRMKTEEIEYFVNNEPLNLSIPLYNVEGVAYIPVLLLEQIYQLEIGYNDITKLLSIKKENYKTGVLSKNAIFRKEPNKKSPYIQKLKKGSLVYFYENEENGYTKVEIDGGYIGFIPTKVITEIEDKDIKNNYKNDYVNKPNWNIYDGKINLVFDQMQKVEANSSESRRTYHDGDIKNNYKNDYVNKPNWNIYDGKINLVFDQMQKVEANSSESRRTYHDGVDVLVPTWFSFKDESGKILNIADRGYVDWAHNNGYRVWGLLTDNFDKKISHSVLTSTETREYVIKQLLAYVSMYNLDGINIDFESVPKEDGDSFIQFLRELAPALRKEGVVLSVDLFVPKPWTAHYNRNDVGKIADYVIVMGYDEHYAGLEKRV